MIAPDRPAKGLRGIHVFWIVAAFFGVIFAVDGVFITRAVTTFPGEESMNPYVQGIDFNQTLEQRAAQKRLGWTAQIGLVGQSSQILVVRIRDADGAPIVGLDVLATVHVTGQANEAEIALTSNPSGDYTGSVAIKRGARLAVVAEGRRPGNATLVFGAEKTLVVQ